jgi:hypothetical protein
MHTRVVCTAASKGGLAFAELSTQARCDREQLVPPTGRPHVARAQEEFLAHAPRRYDVVFYTLRSSAAGKAGLLHVNLTAAAGGGSAAPDTAAKRRRGQPFTKLAHLVLALQRAVKRKGVLVVEAGPLYPTNTLSTLVRAMNKVPSTHVSAPSGGPGVADQRRVRTHARTQAFYRVYVWHTVLPVVGPWAFVVRAGRPVSARCAPRHAVPLPADGHGRVQDHSLAHCRAGLVR